MKAKVIATRIFGMLVFAAACVVLVGNYGANYALEALLKDHTAERPIAYALVATMAISGILLVLDMYVLPSMAAATASGIGLGVMSYEKAKRVRDTMSSETIFDYIRAYLKSKWGI